jgi:hypothetical protein
MLGYKALLTQQQQAGSLLNTFTTAKSIINPEALYTVPANFFKNLGATLEIDVWGAISNIVTTPGTITFQVMMGPTANIIVFTTGAIQLNATAHATLPFHLKIRLTLDSVGSGTSAKFRGQGEINGVMFTATAGQTDGANTQTTLQVPATAPAVGTGFDATVAQLLDLWAGFSISNAGNGVQVHQYTVSSDN